MKGADGNLAKIDKVQEVSVEQLIPYAKNAKKHSTEQVNKIAASISAYGFLSPCLIDKEFNVIAGHGRIMAARKLGMKKIPCLFIEGLTEEQRRAYILADNKLTEMGEWDMDLVFEECADLKDMDFDISLTGFEEEFEAHLDAETAAVEDDFDIEPPEEPISKLGDIWQLGRHRLMCGDSTDAESVQRLVGGEMVDMLLTDPPYGVDYEGRTKEALKIANDNLESSDFIEFLSSAFAAAKEVMKPGAVFYVWYAMAKSLEFFEACKRVGWEIRQTLIWEKNSIALGRQDYQWKHEPCLYGWKDGASHLWASDRKQTTVLKFDKPSRNGEHPTMKPVPLFDYQIKNNTKGGDIVLDLFGGSGTTIIACEQNGRVGYSMEYDSHYVDVIVKRWEQLTGEKAVLVNG